LKRGRALASKKQKGVIAISYAEHLSGPRYQAASTAYEARLGLVGLILDYPGFLCHTWRPIRRR